MRTMIGTWTFRSRAAASTPFAKRVATQDTAEDIDENRFHVRDRLTGYGMRS